MTEKRTEKLWILFLSIVSVVMGVWSGYMLSGHKLNVSVQWSEVTPEDYKK
jgi:hypothetical protein